jgi:hypothetical protein
MTFICMSISTSSHGTSQGFESVKLNVCVRARVCAGECEYIGRNATHTRVCAGEGPSPGQKIYIHVIDTKIYMYIH